MDLKDKQYVSEAFAKLIVNARYDYVDEEVIKNAKMILLDYLGNLIGSKTADTFSNAVGVAESLGGPEECTVLGSSKKVSAMNAVLANAIGGYSFDFVDDHNDSLSHPSPATIPTALALAEKNHLSGIEFMESFMVGNEIIARAGSAYMGNMYKQCFHPSGVLGTMGATASACKAMKLDEKECASAQGIAINSMAGGLYAWNSIENNAKRINAAQPARNGILAAILAQAGFVGPIDAYEGRYGAFNAFGYQKEWNSEQALRNLGDEWQFANSSIKPYPACRYSGANIDACLDVLENNEVELEGIERIVFASQSAQIENIMLPVEDKMNPRNMVEMQHSLPYCGAVALAKGRFTVDELDIENLNDPLIRDLMNKITYVIDEELDARYPEAYSTSVVLKMKDGRELRSVVDYPLGDWRNPVDEEFVLNKFRNLAGRTILNHERIEAIIENVRNIEDVTDMAMFMDLINCVIE